MIQALEGFIIDSLPFEIGLLLAHHWFAICFLFGASSVYCGIMIEILLLHRWLAVGSILVEDGFSIGSLLCIVGPLLVYY